MDCSHFAGSSLLMQHFYFYPTFLPLKPCVGKKIQNFCNDSWIKLPSSFHELEMFEEYCNSSELEMNLMVFEFSWISGSIPMTATSSHFVYVIVRASELSWAAGLPSHPHQSLLFRAVKTIFLNLFSLQHVHTQQLSPGFLCLWKTISKTL